MTPAIVAGETLRLLNTIGDEPCTIIDVAKLNIYAQDFEMFGHAEVASQLTTLSLAVAPVDDKPPPGFEKVRAWLLLDLKEKMLAFIAETVTS